MWSWLRRLTSRAAKEHEFVDAAAEEKEFFDAWDEMGWPDYDAEGNPIYPTWDEAAERWVYPHRDEDPPHEVG